MKIISVRAELLQADKQAEYTQTERQNEANGHLSKLCIFAYNLLNYLVFQITPISITASNYGYTVWWNCYVVRYFVVTKDFSLRSANCISNNILPPPANISTTAMCPFTSYELWTKQHIIVAAGSGRKLVGPFHRLKSNKRSTICTEQNTSWWTDSRSAGTNSRTLFKLTVLSVAAQQASIVPSHRHFAHQCCVTLSVNVHR